jgi:hypothetical protein
MTIVSRGAPALLALLAGGACTSQTINLLTPAPGDASTQAHDAAIDGAARSDASRAPDAAAMADAVSPPDAPGGCPELVDQRLGECMSPPVSQCNSATDATSDGFAVAQVFAPVFDGAIPELRLWMYTVDPAHDRAIVSIADLRGDPRALLDPSYSIDGHILATTLSAMSGGYEWQRVVFASPATVRANQPYAIYVRATSTIPGASASANWGQYNDNGHPTLDPYPRGDAFGFSPTAGWIAQPLWRKMMFEVHIIPSSCN